MDTSEEFKGKYLNMDSTKDGDIGELLDGGVVVEIKDKFTGKMKAVRNITVNVGGIELIWSPWASDGRAIQKAWGMESDGWKGKKIQILHVNKKMVIRPIVAEKK